MTAPRERQRRMATRRSWTVSGSGEDCKSPSSSRTRFIQWERLRCSGRAPAGEATARRERCAANEKGDREAVNNVAIENLDLETARMPPEGWRPLANGFIE